MKKSSRGGSGKGDLPVRGHTGLGGSFAPERGHSEQATPEGRRQPEPHGSRTGRSSR